MKLPIQNKTVFVPGEGNAVANVLEVRVASYQLGQSATAFYDLQRRTVTPATEDAPEQVIDESLGLSGNCDLTPAQFASWGQDDDFFARSIAQNLGLFPTVNA